MSGVNVVLAQLTPELRDAEANMGRAEEILSHHAGADLFVFPELFLGGYTTNEVEALAFDLHGSEVGKVARLARENDAAVVFGLHERVPGGVANSALCLGRRGDVAGVYRKTHLFGEERGAFVAGDELLVVDLGGVRAGIMICFDVEFPEVARSLALAGANMLVTVSANMDPFGRDHDVFATARALENGLPHLYVNQVGRGEAFTFAGGTMAVSADGDRLAEAGGSEGEILVSLDLSARNEERPEELRPQYLEEMRGALPVAPRRGLNEGPPRPQDREGRLRPERFVALETGRLLLRRFRRADLAPFLAYRNDPEVARYQDWEGCTEGEALRMIRALEREEPFTPGEWFQFALELKETGELVGDLGFKVGEDRQAEVGYTLARAHWGKGYASEAVSRLLDHAFGVLGLHRVYAIADQENQPSVAVLERIGMRREGAFVENTWFKGRWSSEYLYATLRGEWLARGKTPG